METKEEYFALRERMQRDEEVSMEEALAADRFVKETTLKNLDKKLAGMVTQPLIRQFVTFWCDARFGATEIDTFLVEIKAYPEWL